MSLGDILRAAFPEPQGSVYVECEDDARIEVEDLGLFKIESIDGHFECSLIQNECVILEVSADLPQTALRQVLNDLDAMLSAQVEQVRKARDTLI